jgi:hypothetical protein
VPRPVVIDASQNTVSGALNINVPTKIRRAVRIRGSARSVMAATLAGSSTVATVAWFQSLDEGRLAKSTDRGPTGVCPS